MLDHLRRSLERTTASLGVTDSLVELIALFERHYSEPDRHYHTLTHVAACLHLLEVHADLAEHRTEVEIALWFHDVVYDVKAKDNEGRSAALARKLLLAAGVAPPIAESVSEHVLATAHDSTPENADSRLAVDIDLGILAAEPDVYDRYTGQIRREYAWVPDGPFREGRATFLSALLARPWLYATERFRTEFEDRARANLNRECTQLQA